MNKERLLKLADFLDTVPRKSFDMRDWVAQRGEEFNPEEPGSCGFAGCAMGWAAHAKLFHGFSVGPPEHWAAFTYRGEPIGGFTAGEKLFQISGDASGHLFDPWAYRGGSPTPKTVAKRIRVFVKSDGAIP
jgi:hypothetical protein